MKSLKRGDLVAIVSPSSGILGEPFISHELELGIKRLKELGLEIIFMENSLKGLDFIEKHPEKRAEDIKNAFKDKKIKAIISAIGGNDSYKLIPYLAADQEFKKIVKENPKIFTGYSDTTTIHILLNSLGLDTFYGPAFITDFAEFENDMLKYTKDAVNYFFEPKSPLKIMPSEVWYDERTDFSPAAVGTNRISHIEEKGYELIQGKGKAQGKLFGGCIEILARFVGYKNLPDDEHENLKQILEKFPIFPKPEDFKDKILFIETSDNKPSPADFKDMLKAFKNYGIFDYIKGMLVGKPMDEAHYSKYKQILSEELKEYDFPVLYNLNFGHSFPRTVLPYGALAEIDANNKTLTLQSSTLKN